MRKFGLGRSLSELLPAATALKPTLAAPQGMMEVAISGIRRNPYQPRSSASEDGLRELADSIAATGMLSPVIVRKSSEAYELVAGERRLRAAEMAGLKTVPAIVRPATDQEMIRLALVENLQREDLNAVDTARAYQVLVEQFGMTQEQVAQAVGKSRSAVANALRLLSLPEEILESIAAGAISEGHGRALLPLAHQPRVWPLWRKAVRGRLTVRQAEAAVRRIQRAEARPAAPCDPNLASLETRLSEALSTPVRIRHNRKKGWGSLVIAYYSLADLNTLSDRLLAG